MALDLDVHDEHDGRDEDHHWHPGECFSGHRKEVNERVTEAGGERDADVCG